MIKYDDSNNNNDDYYDEKDENPHEMVDISLSTYALSL